MSNQLSNTVLRQSTRNINKQTRSMELQNNKTRSKSLALQKAKSDQENSMAKLKKYEKQLLEGIKLNHCISAEESFQKRSRLDIECYPGKQIKREQEKNILFDLCTIELKLNHNKQEGRRDSTENKKERMMNCEVKQPLFKAIKSVIRNENGYVYLDNQGKVHFLSLKNEENHELSNFVNLFFETQQSIITSIFCTPYSVFFIDKLEQLYGMGLNDRGQIGVSTLGFIQKPVRIPLCAESDKTFNKSSEFIAANEKLNKFQKVTKIAGGPFHTVILTNSFKVYYSGTLYGENELMNDEFLCSFKEVKIKNQTIKDIECGITSVVFRTHSNKVYAMGLFGDKNFYSVPTQLQFNAKSGISQVTTANDWVYTVSGQGQLFQVNMKKKLPFISEIKLHQLFSNSSTKDNYRLQCTVHFIFTSFEKIILVVKYSKDLQKPQYKYFLLINENQVQFHSHFQQINLSFFKLTPPKKMFILNNHVYCLQESQIIRNMLKQAAQQIQQSQKANKVDVDSYMQKIKQLEQQNFRLKKQNALLEKDKRQKTPKMQQKIQLSGINYNFQKQVTPRTFTHDLEIQFSEIKLTKKIAEGGYGIIYRGEWKKTEVAVKIFKIDDHNTNSVKQFISECRAMEALRHPNIVMFLGACMKKPNFSIVLEYCEGGTLWSLLQNHKIALSWQERISLALQTAKAMNYLHDRKNPIVHRDLKSLNVLLDGNRKVKLADFGWTKSLENYMTSKIGTYQWMAPQVLTGQRYSQKADVFSFSIILWQIASREPPYKNINGIQVAYDVANKQFRPSMPSGVPSAFQKLIVECWQKDPQKRPSFKEIIDNLERQLKSSN